MKCLIDNVIWLVNVNVCASEIPLVQVSAAITRPPVHHNMF